MDRFRAGISLGIVLGLIAVGLAAAVPRSPGNVELSMGGITLETDHAGPPCINDVIFINATIDNFGDEPAFNVTVIFSYNTTNMSLFQVGRVELNATGTVIGPASSAVASCAWNTSGLDLSPGVNYSVYAEVQNDTQPANQSDPDLSNNIAFANITFLPDVVPAVTDMSSSTDNAVVGETVTLSATLANTGIRPAKAEPVSFFLDGSASPFCTTSVDIPVTGGATARCEWNTTTATDGKHNLTARVRQTSKTTQVSLKYRTNPYVASMTSSSYGARVGDVLAINATLNNNGVETADLVTVDFYLDTRGVPLGNLTADAVPVGQPTMLSFSWDTAGTDPGTHTIKARIAGTSREMRTANITLDVELFPDLEITAVELGDPSPLAGSVVNVSITVTNIGDSAPRQNTTLQVLLDSVESVMEMTLEPLGPGQHLDTSFDWDTTGTTPARHTLRVQVNPYGDFPELNDENNDRVVQLELRGSLDLSVQGITFSRSLNQSNATTEVTAGQGLWIWVNVANGGTLSSAANTTLALSLDGAAPFKTFSLYPISPGRNYTAQYNWDTSGFNDTAPTVHSVRAEVDAAGQNNDSDRSNNALSANLTVIPPIAEADLAVTSVRTANPSARYEEVLMVTATVVNLGGRSARNFTVRFTYQSGSNPQLIGDQTVPSVLPGEQRNVTQAWTVLVGEGNYTVGAVVDPQNAVLETNKSNNAGSTKVAVLPAEVRRPELRLGAPQLDPREPKKGRMVNVTITITNSGNAPATGLVVTLIAGGQPSGELNIPDLPAQANRTVTLGWRAESGGKDLLVRVSGDNLAATDSASVRVDIAGTPAAGGGDYLPMLILIGVLVVVAAAMVALGGRRKEQQEEE